MNKQTLTQGYLKSVLNYNPETGLFTRIKITSPSVKIGDIAGYEVHSKCTGHKHYIQISVKSKSYYAHRLAWLYMTGSWPEFEVDHDDGDGTNNKWLNLNRATKLENLKNKRQYRNNSSGVTGVSWYKPTKKWFASIGVNNETVRLGYHKDFFEAVCARKSADNKYDFHPNHGSERPL